MSAIAAPTPVVASRDVWQAERQALLAEEKAVTRALDALAARRRALPWVRIEKDYAFTGEEGPLGLADLFGQNSQLVVYHFMFGPGWREGCDGCSFVADHFDGADLHLRHHDVSLVAVSRAPLAEFLPFKRRMGWRFAWVSSAGSDFNYDFGATDEKDQEQHGLSVFARGEDGRIFHTYSTQGRGVDLLIGAHNILDMTPKGRNEQGVMDWVRHHDRYAPRPA
jgi:predicted dithiol-disulfide oxidoreductase (DUF899 family)